MAEFFKNTAAVALLSGVVGALLTYSVSCLLTSWIMRNRELGLVRKMSSSLPVLEPFAEKGAEGGVTRGLRRAAQPGHPTVGTFVGTTC
jgi:hypothetical protein